MYRIRHRKGTRFVWHPTPYDSEIQAHAMATGLGFTSFEIWHNANEPIWVTGNGRSIRVAGLSDAHLRNILSYVDARRELCRSEGRPFVWHQKRCQWADLQNEFRRRSGISVDAAIRQALASKGRLLREYRL